MSELNIPNVILSDGHTIPQVGLGVFKVEPGETARAVTEALDAGYRHIDTASYYFNEAEVGAALAASDVARDDVFVTTKLWNDRQEDAHEAFEESLARLGLDRVDLYLVHWPVPMFGTAPGAWRSLIEIQESGLATNIGVSNFEIEHLQQLIDETGVTPAVNQIELHPLNQRRELRAFCAEHGIAVEAWGPLAQGKSDVFERTQIVDAANAHGKTPAQIVLRWHVQAGTIVIPKSSRRERMIENASIFDFSLTPAEVAAIDAMDEQKNFGPDPRTMDMR